MLTNTKTLFISVLKAVGADCVCDIGSRDGFQSLLFRHLLPNAAVIAFEANPINFEMMQMDPRLNAAQIDLYSYAITDTNASARFHITDVDYSGPRENTGMSSLLVHEGLKILKSVDVNTMRIDDFVLSQHPQVMNVGLWIDVEGVEYAVLEGMAKIKDRVVAVHVETAKTPMRGGQRTFSELIPLMQSYDFVLFGSNIAADSNWGDVVFIRQAIIDRFRTRLTLCKVKAQLSNLVKVDHIAVFLRRKFPGLYCLLRQLYIRFWA